MDRNEQTRRVLIGRLAATLALGATWSVGFSQAAPPPPPPGAPGPRPREPRPRPAPPHYSSFLPTTSDVLYRLRSQVTIERDEALKLEGIVEENLARQRSLLKGFGIDPDYDVPPNFRLSRKDARDLNDALDDLMDVVEDDADKVLSSRARSEFRRIVRSASSRRESAINSLRR